jgi:hypothetical protein
MPDLGPLFVFGAWCFWTLIGAILGIVAFLATDNRWALLVGLIGGQVAFMWYKRKYMPDG